jgi:hypothetical protein
MEASLSLDPVQLLTVDSVLDKFMNAILQQLPMHPEWYFSTGRNFPDSFYSSESLQIILIYFFPLFSLS